MNLDFDIQNYLRISPTDMLLVCISTLLIVLIAKHFFWDKVVAYIERRQAFIQENIDASEKSKQEAEVLKQQYEAQLKDVHLQAQDILQQAHQSASYMKKEVLAEANAEAVRMKEQASEAIAQEKLAAYKEIKDVIEDVALDTAEKLIGRKLDEEAHRKYVQELLSEGEDAWQK